MPCLQVWKSDWTKLAPLSFQSGRLGIPMNAKTEERVVFWSFLAPLLSPFLSWWSYRSSLGSTIPLPTGTPYREQKQLSSVGQTLPLCFKMVSSSAQWETTVIYTIYAVILINTIGLL